MKREKSEAEAVESPSNHLRSEGKSSHFAPPPLPGSAFPSYLQRPVRLLPGRSFEQ